MTERPGRKRKQLLDDLEGTRACLNLKEKDVSPTLWGTYLEETMDLSLREITELINQFLHSLIRFAAGKFVYL